MPYGYIGDTSTSIKQVKNNAGVLSVNDVLDLESKGHLGGKHILLDEKNPDGTTTTLEFLDLQENKYKVHLFVWNNIEWTPSADTCRVRVSNDGGTTYESSSTYDSAYESLGVTGSYTTALRNNYDSLDRVIQNTQNYAYSGQMYMYNAGNSSLYTTFSLHGYFTNAFRYGGGGYLVAETINAVKFYLTSMNFSNKGSIKLYGVVD